MCFTDFLKEQLNNAYTIFTSFAIWLYKINSILKRKNNQWQIISEELFLDKIKPIIVQRCNFVLKCC